MELRHSRSPMTSHIDDHRCPKESMRFAIAIVVSLLVSQTGSAQLHKGSAAAAAIKRARNVRVSSFDPALPNLTLQSFLEYETGHAQSEWTTIECESSADLKNALCVRTSSEVDDQISVFVTVQVPKSVTSHPTLVSVEVTDHGLVHPIRLIELPVVTHGRRFRPQSIRDIPPFMSSAG